MHNLRVALCLSGQMRTYKQCYYKLKKNIIDVLEPDIFIHTWKDTGTKIGDMETTCVSKSELKEMYNPISLNVEEFKKDFFYAMHNLKIPKKLKGVSGHKTILPMHHKMKACNELKKKQEKRQGALYDVVIKSRPDMYINEKIPESTLYCFNILWHYGWTDLDNQVSDMFALSSSKNMDYYCSILDNIQKYWNDNVFLAGGTLMKYHVKQTDIQTKPLYLNFHVMRDAASVSYTHLTLPTN